MSGFIRVRAVDGPAHEFDAPVGEVDANPDLYTVINPEISPVSREPRYADTVVEGTPLIKLSRSELDDLARSLGIDPTAAKNKGELVDLIDAAPSIPVVSNDDRQPQTADTDPAGTPTPKEN